MKVLHLNTDKTWRGGEQQTLYLLQRFKERGIFCHLVCQAGSPMQSGAICYSSDNRCPQL